MITIKVCATNILTDLGRYGFTKYQTAGFFFYLGYCSDRFSLVQGLYSRQSSEKGKMNEFPTSYLLDEEYEVQENLFDSEVARSCFVTFAKVIQEDWNKGKAPLSNFVNIGPNYLFTDEFHEGIMDFNVGKKFIGRTIDEGYLDFFETLGSDLNDQDITEINDCVWYGKDLYFASVMDDQNSYNYVVDKLNVLMPPCLKIFLTYPYDYWTSSRDFAQKSLFSKVLKASLSLESNATIRDLTYDWHNKSLLNQNGGLIDDYDSMKNNLGSVLLKLTQTAYDFKNSISKEEFNEIYNDSDVYEFDSTGQIIDLKSYSYLINEVVRLTFGYDFGQKNWSNNGMLLQFLSFYFMTAVRYSVYPKDVINN